MMRTLRITEAREHQLELSEAEALALQTVGRRMIGSRSWWGNRVPSDGSERTVLRVARTSEGRWSVRAGNVIGVVVVGDLQIVIRPKIPTAHLLYLLHVGGHVPRFDASVAGSLAGAESLYDLLATWFIKCLEDVLRADLMRDYRPAHDLLPVLRGKLRPTETAQHFYRGRLGLACDYEDYNVDSPLNRLLKAAARAVASNPALDRELQRRALRATARMSDVGELGPADQHQVVVERRTRHCADAATLARQILTGKGLTIETGPAKAWTFLIETSSPVENGLRHLIRQHLPAANVRKRGIQLGDTTMSMNPDLVFGAPDAVADVKYKISGREWDRSDLYQLVAFATGYRVREAALFAFGPVDAGVPRPVQVGDVRATPTVWDTSHQDPELAGKDFVRRVGTWLERSPGLQGRGT